MLMRNDFKRKLLFFLLMNPDSSRTKYDIAKNVVGCHPTWGVKIFNELQEKKIVKNTKVVDYRELIELYRKYFKQFKAVHLHVPNPDSLLKLADKQGLQFAITSYWADKRVTKFLFPSKFEAYINASDLDAWLALLPKVSGAVGKGNVRLFLANKDFLEFYTDEMTGFKVGRIVSSPQLAVDLLNEGGPAVQAAEMIIEKIED